jgi:hypothetical protein
MQDNEPLRRQLAHGLIERLRGELPGLSAHMGEDYREASDPEAVHYRHTGAPFHWLAFAISPWRMWDLHVGIVDVHPLHLSVGLHISERAAEPLLEGLKTASATFGAAAEHRPAAAEYQANLPPMRVEAGDTAQLERTIGEMCRAMARLAAQAAPPAAMRST